MAAYGSRRAFQAGALLLACAIGLASASVIGSHARPGGQPGPSGDATQAAFPGLEGFGKATVGGRHGRVVKVTTLADDGAGSLRWALEELTEPRIVVFGIGGLIQLDDQIEVNGDVTVAGQTAPGGITIAGGRLRIVGSNVIIQGLRIRPGDGRGQSPESRDGISIGKDGVTVERVVIDHNSLTWSVDENLSIWGDVHDVTISNNIIAESLDHSVHPKGPHGMGLLIGGGGASRITVLGNLIAHNQHRNPLIKGGSQQIQIINNVVYNWGQNGFQLSDSSSLDVVGNVFIPGRNSRERPAMHLNPGRFSSTLYLNDNVGSIEIDPSARLSDSPVLGPSAIHPWPSSDVAERVLSGVGARSPALDAIDKRIVESAVRRVGRIIDSQDEVGGYMAPIKASSETDSDNDAIPDRFEALIGSDPQLPDANEIRPGNGLSNIEEYLNRLIGPV